MGRNSQELRVQSYSDLPAIPFRSALSSCVVVVRLGLLGMPDANTNYTLPLRRDSVGSEGFVLNAQFNKLIVSHVLNSKISVERISRRISVKFFLCSNNRAW